jgi:hypothetical protein
MSNAVDILAAGGICNAQLVAEIADTAGLELAAAAAMLEKESSGAATSGAMTACPPAAPTSRVPRSRAPRTWPTSRPSSRAGPAARALVRAS